MRYVRSVRSVLPQTLEAEHVISYLDDASNVNKHLKKCLLPNSARPRVRVGNMAEGTVVESPKLQSVIWDAVAKVLGYS